MTARLPLLLGLALCGLSAPLRLDAASDGQSSAFVRVEHFDLPMAEALAVARTALVDDDHAAAWARLGQLVAEGKVVRAATSGCESVFGGQADGVVEWKVPDDFSPPDLPGTEKAAVLPAGRSGPEICPLSFEKRLIGSSMVWDKGGQSSDHTSTLARTNLQIELTRMPALRSMGDGGVRIEMPDFHRRLVKSCLNLPPGQWRLVSFLPATHEAGSPQGTLVWARLDPFRNPLVPAGSAPDAYRLLAECYEVPADECGVLLASWNGNPDGGALRKAVEECVARGKGRLVSSSLVSGNDLADSRLASGPEAIHATRFDEPGGPASLPGPILHREKALVPASPTAYEMEPAGWTISSHITWAEDRRSLLGTLRIAFTTHDIDITCGRGPAQVSVPFFRKDFFRSTCRLALAEPCLVMVTTPPVRVDPPPETTRCEDWSRQPEYRTTGGSRHLLFLTANIDSNP